MKTLKNLDKLTSKGEDYFDSQIVNIFNKNFSELLVQYEEWWAVEKNRPQPEEPKDEDDVEPAKKEEEKPKPSTEIAVPKTDEESKEDAKKFLLDMFE